MAVCEVINVFLSMLGMESQQANGYLFLITVAIAHFTFAFDRGWASCLLLATALPTPEGSMLCAAEPSSPLFADLIHVARQLDAEGTIAFGCQRCRGNERCRPKLSS